MKREEKGITLVALIITIIVLLILAVVSIQAVTGTGLFSKTSDAVDKYQNSTEKESSIMDNHAGVIEEYLNGGKAKEKDIVGVYYIGTLGSYYDIKSDKTFTGGGMSGTWDSLGENRYQVTVSGMGSATVVVEGHKLSYENGSKIGVALINNGIVGKFYEGSINIMEIHSDGSVLGINIDGEYYATWRKTDTNKYLLENFCDDEGPLEEEIIEIELNEQGFSFKVGSNTYTYNRYTE